MVLKGGYVPPPPPTPTPVYIPKPKPISTSKWITPSDSVCKANGGRIDEYGICEANWKNAKKICRASGGTLPSKEVLGEVVTDCGGLLNDWESKKMKKNGNNSNYQSCYKNKGFSDFYSYWSSTSISSSNDYAWIVYVYSGAQYSYDKVNSVYVRCVRAGE
ncbi:hypothetical protein MNB_SV-13-244 [hydrothermal vent metagenome]|uniref:DUF1566 domain-containing protein n=1 Tax=hydrothermal vent metagenome TaxID=652676 RepID=A0A1W1CWV2_9ZZZZ